MSQPVRPLQYTGPSSNVTPGSILTAARNDGSVGQWAAPFNADVINHVGENTVSLFGIIDTHNELVTGLGKTGIATVKPHLWFSNFGKSGLIIEHTHGSTTTTKTYRPYITNTELIPISKIVTDFNALFPSTDLEWKYQGDRLLLFIKTGSVKFLAPSNSGTASDQFLAILFNGSSSIPSIYDPILNPIVYNSPKCIFSEPFIGSPDNIYPLPANRPITTADMLLNRTSDSVALTFQPATPPSSSEKITGKIDCEGDFFTGDGILRIEMTQERADIFKNTIKLDSGNEPKTTIESSFETPTQSKDSRTINLDRKDSKIELINKLEDIVNNTTTATNFTIKQFSPHIAIQAKEDTEIRLGDDKVEDRASIKLDTTNDRLEFKQGSTSTDTALYLNMPITDGTSAGNAGQVLRSEGTSGAPAWRYGGAAFVKMFQTGGTLKLTDATNSSDGIANLYSSKTDYYYVRIFAQGGGGGGAGGAGGTSATGGGGGGAGRIHDTFLKLKEDTELIIVVGSGGGGGAAESKSQDPNFSDTRGSNGFPTTVTINDGTIIQTITALGGDGGESSYTGGSLGGAGSVAGETGKDSNSFQIYPNGPTYSYVGGKGGGFYGGANGIGNINNPAPGANATSDMKGGRGKQTSNEIYSGAGGGGGQGGPDDQYGGEGAPGFVRIEIYME